MRKPASPEIDAICYFLAISGSLTNVLVIYYFDYEIHRSINILIGMSARTQRPATSQDNAADIIQLKPVALAKTDTKKIAKNLPKIEQDSIDAYHSMSTQKL